MARSEIWNRAFYAALPGVITNYSNLADPEMLIQRTIKIADLAEKAIRNIPESPAKPHDFEQPT